MDYKSKQLKKIRNLAITGAGFLLLLSILLILKGIPGAKVTMQRILSRTIINVMGRATGWIPFSLYEILLYLGGVFIIASIVMSIVFLCKKRALKALRTFLRLVLVAIIVATVYFASAGFSYASDGYVRLYNDPINNAELLEICNYFIDDFNSISLKMKRDKDGNIIQPYSDRKLAAKLVEEYKRIDHPSMSSYTPHAKTITSSRVMSEMHIMGVFFAPFGEANINKDMPAAQKPHTMAHELAHAKGIMREYEADLMATYVTLTSDDDYIRYSGYMETIYSLLSAFSSRGITEKYVELSDKIAPEINHEDWNIFLYWISFDFFDNIISKTTNFFNDIYLRLMGENKGTGSYTPPIIDIPTPDVDPDTGDIIINPDTGMPNVIYLPYDDMQKLYFEIYKNNNEI